MKIKKIIGTAEDSCPCESWLKHWEKFSGQTTLYCPVTGCLNKDLVGAHVQRVGVFDDRWYVFPLCKFHSQSQKELEVADAYLLVLAKKGMCE